MTANPAPADELDRLFACLVRAIRDQRPDRLAAGLDVSELLSFVPYKTVRGEIGVSSNDDYGHAVTRLLSGEKGLVFADDLMQDDLRAELTSKNPDLQAYRSYLNTRIALAQERVRAALDALGPAPARDVVPAASPASPKAAPRTAPPAAGATAARTGAPPARPAAVHTSRERPIPQIPRAVPDAMAAAVPGVDVRAARPGCRYCGQPLPHGREVRFCPYCGQDLSVHRCGACSAEIEPGWKFCVSCGRAATP